MQRLTEHPEQMWRRRKRSSSRIMRRDYVSIFSFGRKRRLEGKWKIVWF